MAAMSVKPTAAAPSFNRLVSTVIQPPIDFHLLERSDDRHGSVAAMRSPNNHAPIQLQPTSKCIPTATKAADNDTRE
jgi:hypothetical protein